MRAEKQEQDKLDEIKCSANCFFNDFLETYAHSDKKSYKDNLTPFFATMENCAEYVDELYAKYEDRNHDKWYEIIKNIHD